MVVFTAVSLLSLCVLLAQGIRVIMTGNMRPFFWRPGRKGNAELRLKPAARIFVATLYVASSALLMYAVFDVTSSRHDGDGSLARPGGYLSSMIIGLCLVGYGLRAITRPDIVIRAVLAIYVDTGTMYSERASFRMTVMLLGAIFVCAGIALLLR
jgi:hypothetical protein